MIVMSSETERGKKEMPHMISYAEVILGDELYGSVCKIKELPKLEILKTDLAKIKWPVRIANAFINNNICTLEQLVGLRPYDLIRLKSFGRASVITVESVLFELGLRLAPNVCGECKRRLP